MEIGPSREQRVVHLILFIPGMGPHESKLPGQLATLRQKRDIVMHELGTQHTIEFVGIDWQSKLHQQQLAAVDTAINAVSLGNLDTVRHFINRTTMDIVFYLSPSHRHKMIDILAEELNTQYLSFCKGQPPQTRVLVSLFAHSLGSVIAFDLLGLSSPRLVFDVQYLLAAGSAIGLFLATRGVALRSLPEPPFIADEELCTSIARARERSASVPGPSYPAIGQMQSPHTVPARYSEATATHNASARTRFFNIFHPFDPLAYRVEPFALGEFPPEPVPIPKFRNLQSPHRMIRRRASSETPTTDWNGRTRYDFALQPKKTHSLNSLSNHVAMVQVHNKYVSSKDLMLFMLQQCLLSM
eukprot:TRINITY_DN1477_c0_g1_i2.p1 TRINITY_DN1477_c0_g1~~TRINITY_DN1477_c0_g1_i2.p1  ORF type:complete len:356 (-),score=43.48 TRINITY_DN1477_c0_g1_i2:62-1129(-)